MYFIDGIIALAERLGCQPDDVYLYGLLAIIFWWELLGYCFAGIFLFLRWVFRRIFSWLRSRHQIPGQ